MKTKTVTLNGREYELRKMTPFTGSHIYMRMMGALVGYASSENAQRSSSEADAKEEPRSDEEKARLLCLLAFMRMNFEDANFARQQALRVVSRREVPDAPAIPVMAEDGRFAFQDVEDDAALTQSLVFEALVFSLASFLSGSTSNQTSMK